MIDYLICFPTDADRQAAFPPPESNPPCWEASGGTAMPVTITIADPTFDPDGNLLTPAVFGPGSWLALRTPDRSPEIEAMPACLLATDGDLAAAGLPYVHFCRLQPTTLLGAVSPTFSGDGYLIPAGQPASVLSAMLIEP